MSQPSTNDLLQQLIALQQAGNAKLDSLVTGLTPFSATAPLQLGAGPLGAPAVPGVYSVAALKSELLNDPASLGYAALRTAGAVAALAACLNFPRDGTTPFNGTAGAAVTVWRNDIAPKEIEQAIAPVDFTAGTQIQISKLNLMFVPGVIDATLANVRSNMQGIFVAASAATTNALSALAQRTGSRAEALWGTGFQVTDSLVVTALNS